MKTRIQMHRHIRIGTNPSAQNLAPDCQETTSARPKDVLHLKSLLVPIDFSESSLKVLDYAVSIAKEFGSQLKLLHVVGSATDLDDRARPIFKTQDHRNVQQAKLRLYALEQDRIDELIPVSTEVRTGRAYQEICDAAQSFKTDVIVISTHGFTGLTHLLLGSTAERVVRHAPCSVLVVRGAQESNARPWFEPKRILVPIDFSENSRRALNYAKGLAKQFQAELQLLYVAPTYYPPTEDVTPDISLLEAELQNSGEKRLARLVRSLASKGLVAQATVRNGRPATEITEAIKELSPDLTVISTHGRTGWNRVFLGSTAEEVVRHAGCPVLIIRKNQPSHA